MTGLVLFAAGMPGVRALDLRPASVPLPDEPEITRDQEGLLLMSEDGPVRLLFAIEVNGRSHGERWADFAIELFRQLDFDGDGVLAGKELESIPTPDLLVDGNVAGSPQAATEARGQLDVDPADGQVTRSEFAAYLKSLGTRSLALEQSAATGPWSGPAVEMTGNGAGQLLFQRLDTNDDKHLDREELSRAEQTLARFDFDGDGTFSRAELQPIGGAYLPRPAPMAAARGGTASYGRLLELSEPPSRLARSMLDRYDKPEGQAAGPASSPAAAAPAAGVSGNDRLSASELRIPRPLFDQHDVNHDGELEFEELLQLAASGLPTVELAVRTGLLRPGQAAVELVSSTANAPVEVRGTQAGTIKIVAPGVGVEIGAAGPIGSPPLRDMLLNQLKAFDTDNNGYLERAEARRSFLGQLFDALDADGDGKVFPLEARAYADRRESQAAGRISANVNDLGRDLFAILDRNQDSRLGKSELNAALARFTEWDTNRDGQLAPGEVTHQMGLTFAPAQPQIPGGPAFFGPVRAQPPRGPGGGPRGEPEWFRRMDRNHDGEITRREFPGTRAAFDRLDANGDGLIDPGEARRGGAE
jgi:Ca2+-binding EF-hand superfamily protein